MFTSQNVFISLLVRPQLVAVKKSSFWLFSKSIGLEDKCQLLSFLSWCLSPFMPEFKALYFTFSRSMDVDHFVTNTTHSLVFIALKFSHPTKLSITQQFTIGCAFS